MRVLIMFHMIVLIVQCQSLYVMRFIDRLLRRKGRKSNMRALINTIKSGNALIVVRYDRLYGMETIIHNAKDQSVVYRSYMTTEDRESIRNMIDYYNAIDQ